METKPSKEFMNSEILFKSVDEDLAEEYLEFFDNAFGQFSQTYRDAKLDGTEDALRCRMIAAIRLAQLGLSMFSFFSSCATSIRSGNADAEACNATARVVSMTVESQVDKWITKAKQAVN